MSGPPIPSDRAWEAFISEREHVALYTVTGGPDHYCAVFIADYESLQQSTNRFGACNQGFNVRFAERGIAS